MRFSALLVCCLATAVHAQDASLQACLQLARQQAGQQLNLQQDCPALFNELGKQGLLSSFDPPLDDAVSVSQLEVLADSRHRLRPAGVIRQDGLERLLADILIVDANDTESDWWQAILKWLNSFKAADHEAQYQWLQRWLEAIKPSEQAAKFIIYASIALLLALSAWLVISELYQAGVFRKFSGGRKPITAADGHHQTPSSPSHPAFQALTPQDQIGVLLAELIKSLVQRKLIPADPSLTHRQLVHHFQKQAGRQHKAFSHLVRDCEPLLYGNRAIDAELVGYYRREVEALIGQSPS